MIVLKGNRMTDRESIHKELSHKLSLPDYYGNNLDALNDCLGERREKALIVISDSRDFLEACGDYGISMLRVFLDNGIQILLD